MANDDWNRAQFDHEERTERERSRGATRGAFGYEGEGYLGEGSQGPRGAHRDDWRSEVDLSRARGGFHTADRGGSRGDFADDRGEGATGEVSPGLSSGRYASEGRYNPGFARGDYARRPIESFGGGRPAMSGDYARGDRFANRPGQFEANAYGDFNRGDYVRANDRGDLPPRPSFRGRGPKGYRRSDERIHEDVCDRLEQDDYVDASDIEVSVNECTVNLSGTVADRAMKRRAEDIAESVNGVRDIRNDLRINGGGSIIDDKETERARSASRTTSPRTGETLTTGEGGTRTTTKSRRKS